MVRKRNGEFVGASSPYGYIKSPEDNHKLIIDKEAAEIVKKIFKWKVNEGMGNVAICHRLNNMGILNPTGYKKKNLNHKCSDTRILQTNYLWCPSTVRNILKNDVYIGNITQGKRCVKSYKIHKLEQVPEEQWITVKNMHEPIIEKELFEKAQKLREVDTRVQNNGKLSKWAGILKCKDCKRAMHKKYCTNKYGTTYEYYICSTYRKKSSKVCTKHTIKLEELETAVLETIKLHIKSFVNMEELLENLNCKRMGNTGQDETNKIIEKKQYEISKISYYKRGLYEDWKNNDITKEEYLEYKQKYEDEIANINKAIINLKEQRKTKDLNDNGKWIEEFKLNQNITKLDRDIITELIDYIEVHENKKITIHFKFMV